MPRHILLDTGILGRLVHTGDSGAVRDARLWMLSLVLAGDIVVLSEICDYELRRKLVRRAARAQLKNLDRLVRELAYRPVTTEILHRAAALWAEARSRGRPTAADSHLDIDAILGAAAQIEARHAGAVIVATTNVRHLSLFADARPWSAIRPQSP